jgi:catecholate siderophore receptor
VSAWRRGRAIAKHRSCAGNTTTSDFYLDGIRDDVQYYRDLYNIDKVEIVKGPNGMIFGRGGAGGAINRVSKQAGWDPVRALSLQAGSYSNKRIAVDVGQPINENVAFRINGMYEDSDSYRDDVTLERYGVNPTVKVRVSDATQIAASVEYFHDERIADRGVSSFAGRPVETDPSTFLWRPGPEPDPHDRSRPPTS